MASRPSRNSARFRQRLSVVYARDTRAGSRLFHASSARRTFWVAVATSKGGRGGRSMGGSNGWGGAIVDENRPFGGAAGGVRSTARARRSSLHHAGTYLLM